MEWGKVGGGDFGRVGGGVGGWWREEELAGFEGRGINPWLDQRRG